MFRYFCGIAHIRLDDAECYMFMLTVCTGYNCWFKMVKCIFIYSAVSSPLDCRKRFTLHPLADLSIPTATRLLWEKFQPCSNYNSLTFPQLSIGRYSLLIYIDVLTGASWRERQCPNFETVAKGIRIRACFRVRHSTAELPRSLLGRK